MKRLVLSIIAVLTLCGRMAAQQVAVADVEAVPGETLSFTIQLDTKGGSYVGLEFDIQFPQDGFITTGNATTTADWNGSFTIGEVGAVGINNLARCGILSYSSTSIPGEGLIELGRVEFTVGNAVSLDDYTVKLTNMTLVGDVRIPVADATFTVSVVNAHNVLLDENATTPPSNVSPANVRVRRTIKANEWSTICLPFTATGEQVKQAWGEDVQLASFTGWESEEDADGAIVAINVMFSSASADEGIAANTPMLIKVSRATETATFDGVSIEPEEAPVVQVGRKASERGYFYGTYAMTTVPEENLFLSGNKFWYSTGATSIKGYRSYFELRDVLDAYYDGSEVKANVFIDDEATGIEMVNGQWSMDNEIYNLAGQRVGRNYKGVVVTKGKKILY